MEVSLKSRGLEGVSDWSSKVWPGSSMSSPEPVLEDGLPGSGGACNISGDSELASKTERWYLYQPRLLLLGPPRLSSLPSLSWVPSCSEHFYSLLTHFGLRLAWACGPASLPLLLAPLGQQCHPLSPLESFLSRRSCGVGLTRWLSLCVQGLVVVIAPVSSGRIGCKGLSVFRDPEGGVCAHSCLTVCDPMDWSPSGSSVPGISQARILEWVAISSSRGSSQPRGWTQVSHVAGGFFTSWATGEPLETIMHAYKNADSIHAFHCPPSIMYWETLTPFTSSGRVSFSCAYVNSIIFLNFRKQFYAT